MDKETKAAIKNLITKHLNVMLAEEALRAAKGELHSANIAVGDSVFTDDGRIVPEEFIATIARESYLITLDLEEGLNHTVKNISGGNVEMDGEE